MTTTTPTHAEQDQRHEETAAEAPEATIASDLLVEDVSIDGMCGVY